MVMALRLLLDVGWWRDTICRSGRLYIYPNYMFSSTDDRTCNTKCVGLVLSICAALLNG